MVMNETATDPDGRMGEWFKSFRWMDEGECG